MRPEERKNKIIELIDQKKFLSVSYLTEQLYSSEATIRRDLAFLEKQGYLKRTTGGALTIKEYYHEQPFEYKSKVNIEQKKYIADLAIDFVSSYQTIFMDSSSTCSYLADKMTALDHLTVLCNGLSTCELLAKNDQNTIYCPGGKILAKHDSIIGESVTGFVDQHFADVSFVSCRGLDAGFGASDFVEDVVNLKKSFRRNSSQVILLLDSNKFEKRFFFQGLTLAEIDVVISDQKPPEKLQEALDSHNIEMVC